VELDGDRHDEVDFGQSASGPLGTFAQRAKKHLRGFGNERVAEPAVGHLTGEPEIRGPIAAAYTGTCRGRTKGFKAAPLLSGSGNGYIYRDARGARRG